MHRILVLHGPNLNALGSREPEVYGRGTLTELNRRLEELAKELGCALESMQTQNEGVMLDALYGAVGRVSGVLLNAGAFTHTSVALRDAVAACNVPVVEVHLSNPAARETFRRRSFLSDAAVAVVQGFGPDSYLLALRGLMGHLERAQTT